jgi:glutathione S-transferase
MCPYGEDNVSPASIRMITSLLFLDTKSKVYISKNLHANVSTDYSDALRDTIRMASVTKTTLWVWPSGLFPRRLIYYFRLKRITLTHLQEHNIRLIPVSHTSSPPALQSLPGHEPRPADSSLPTMRIEHPGGQTVWIRESLSVLEYFEELFPASEGYGDLRGETVERRAQTRDILSLLNDAMHWSLTSLIHSDLGSTSWSGLSGEEMSLSAAAHARRKLDFCLSRLEKWLQANGNEGAKGSTLAGLVLLAQVEYHQMMYGADWVEGHTVLREWVEAMKKTEWYVKSEVLKRVEDGGDWGKVVEA